MAKLFYFYRHDLAVLSCMMSAMFAFFKIHLVAGW